MNLRPLPLELVRAQEKIEGHARRYGLTFFRTVFEMVDYEQMNALAAYGGFPTRYPHYRFGMDYNQMSKSYEYGLHKIYEMVINNDPTYAYLLEGNTMLDQKLVMAHVYGHADFFFNNMYFSHTNRKMIDEMANHATRIRRYQERYGIERVERFIDACLSIEDLIDPNSVFETERKATPPAELAEEPSDGRMPSKPYMDRYINPPEYLEAQRKKREAEQQEAQRFPARPERDVMGFILEHAPLENWERDVLSMIREESYYFLPQRQTKVMNEGWPRTAQQDHDHRRADRRRGHRLRRPPLGHGRHPARTAEPLQAGSRAVPRHRGALGQGALRSGVGSLRGHGRAQQLDRKLGLGRDKIYEVRRVHSDVTFLDEFLTAEFCEEHQLFVTKQDPKTKRAVISSREFNEIKQAMLFQFSNGGRPVIEVIDANFGNRGELCLIHRHVGVDLRWDWAREVLANIVRLWRRPVRLETRRGQKPVRLGHDGENASEDSMIDAAKAS